MLQLRAKPDSITSETQNEEGDNSWQTAEHLPWLRCTSLKISKDPKAAQERGRGLSSSLPV